MQEKSFVTQAMDSCFEQNSDKLVAKSWQLHVVMEHSLAKQLWLVTVCVLYPLYIHAWEYDH